MPALYSHCTSTSSRLTSTMHTTVLLLCKWRTSLQILQSDSHHPMVASQCHDISQFFLIKVVNAAHLVVQMRCLRKSHNSNRATDTHPGWTARHGKPLRHPVILPPLWNVFIQATDVQFYWVFSFHQLIPQWQPNTGERKHPIH